MFLHSFSPEGKANECCKNPTKPECFPIRVPEDDNHFTSTTCLDLRRTVPFCNMEGKIRLDNFFRKQNPFLF